MAAGFVNFASTQTATTGTSLVLTITRPLPGNGLVIGYGFLSTSGGYSISDNAGVTWSINDQQGSAASSAVSGIAYRWIRSLVDAPTTVTVFYPSQAVFALMVAEFSGSAMQTSQRTSSGATSTTSVFCGTTTPTNVPSLVVASGCIATATTTILGTMTDNQSHNMTLPGNGAGTANGSNPIFTNTGGADTSNVGLWLAYEAVSVAAAYSATATLSVAKNHGEQQYVIPANYVPGVADFDARRMI